jgi:adenine phosphoribosyltransferase
MDAQNIEDLKGVIREIPDWPKKGILFYDVTTMLKQGPCFQQAIDALLEPYKD